MTDLETSKTGRRSAASEPSDDRGERRVAGHEEHGEPGGQPSTRPRRPRRRRRRRRSATILPPRAKPRNSGRLCPTIAAAPASDAAEVRRRAHAEQRRERNPSAMSSRTTGDAEPRAVRAPDVGRADVAAARPADVLMLDQPGEPVPQGQVPSEIAENDEPRQTSRGRVAAPRRGCRRRTQSFTTS